jgi:hydrogenase nickel incorporation protein HypA/HybF
MDERELANHVLEVADQTAYQNSARRVIGIQLSIGGRRVLNLEHLASIFQEAARGTVAEGAKLTVIIQPVRHHCRQCGAQFDGPAQEVPCPECGHPRTELTGGEEIRVMEIQVDEPAA